MQGEKKPGREFHWDELDEKGKIERLRRIVKEQDRALSRMATFLDQLMNHRHVRGKLVRPISDPDAENYNPFDHRRYRDDKYF
ncbi:unnamed protein product [marine sediment metagenome]|uniref:Uncharacterized protein n=1 Tax=marine sediment metagenome TaxID=412755 RepID=X1L4E8_9ZZZZ